MTLAFAWKPRCMMIILVISVARSTFDISRQPDLREPDPFSFAKSYFTLPEFAELSSVLLACWPVLTPGAHRIELENGRLLLTLVLGDAVEWLPELDVQADAFYLDGFSPARNPELWSAEFCRLLARRAATGATLATWSVAGSVRRALQGVGFALARQAGFSGKRQMLTGHFCPTSGVRAIT